MSRLALVFAALALSGCRPREITSLERKEADNVVSEADFAVTMKDWKRAEGLFARAAQLCPDAGDSWVNLGIVRMRLGDHSGARSAYKSALSAYGADFDANPSNTKDVLRRAYVLVLLGRADEARSAVDKARAKYPQDRLLRGFADNRGVDGMIATPGLKDISP